MAEQTPRSVGSSPEGPRLARRLGYGDAVTVGVGSIVGTGLYVTLGKAAAAVGWQIVVVVAVAGALALFNGTSSARLAAAFPVSGGTYEYGYRLLRPVVGFGAGWVFVVGKVASAATAVLGASEYAARFLAAATEGAVDFGGEGAAVRVVLAVALALGIGGALAAGHRVTRAVNVVLLAVSFFALLALAAVAYTSPTRLAEAAAVPVGGSVALGREWLHAVAIVFVAFTGYGRIATLGEEVVDPARTIPRAIGSALLVAAVLYLVMAGALLHRFGQGGLAAVVSQGDAPMLALAETSSGRWLSLLVAFGAVASMTCVCANLVLGISRVLVAMGRRGDLPARLAELSDTGAERTPRRAVWTTAILVACLAAVGRVAFTWDLSAFTILVYYGVTHVAAARLPGPPSRFARFAVGAGGAGCFLLAWWVSPPAWATGAALLAVGLLWRGFWRRGRTVKDP
jgi:APA family basic amino acid/polyamine antiporter